MCVCLLVVLPFHVFLARITKKMTVIINATKAANPAMTPGESFLSDCDVVTLIGDDDEAIESIGQSDGHWAASEESAQENVFLSQPEAKGRTTNTEKERNNTSCNLCTHMTRVRQATEFSKWVRDISFAPPCDALCCKFRRQDSQVLKANQGPSRIILSMAICLFSTRGIKCVAKLSKYLILSNLLT